MRIKNLILTPLLLTALYAEGQELNYETDSSGNMQSFTSSTLATAIAPTVELGMVQEGATIRLTPQTSGYNDATEVNYYAWDYDGDGEIDERTTDANISYSYEEAGEYNLTLYVYDTRDGVKRFSKQVSIDEVIKLTYHLDALEITNETVIAKIKSTIAILENIKLEINTLPSYSGATLQQKYDAIKSLLDGAQQGMDAVKQAIDTTTDNSVALNQKISTLQKEMADAIKNLMASIKELIEGYKILGDNSQEAVSALNAEIDKVIATMRSGDSGETTTQGSDENENSSANEGDSTKSEDNTNDAEDSADNTPDAFSFMPQSNYALNSVATSNSVMLTNMDDGVAISIVNGNYSINGGAWTNANGTLNQDDNLSVQLLSANSYDSTTSATVYVGSVEATFSVTTQSAPVAPPKEEIATANLSGYIWLDSNANDEKDANESNILDSDITLTLLQGSNVLNRTELDEAGEYRFSAVEAGNYQLYISTERGFSIEEDINVTSYTKEITLSGDSVYAIALDAYGSNEESTDEHSNDENRSLSSDDNASSSSEASTESSGESSSAQHSNTNATLGDEESIDIASTSNTNATLGSEESIDISNDEAPILTISSFIKDGFIYLQVKWHHNNMRQMLVHLIHQIRIIRRTRANSTFEGLTCSVDGVEDANLCSISEDGEIILDGVIDPASELSLNFRVSADSDIESVEVSASGAYDINGDGSVDSADATLALSNNNYSESVQVSTTDAQSALEQTSATQTSTTQEVAIPFMDNLAKLLMIFGFFGLALLFLRGVK